MSSATSTGESDARCRPRSCVSGISVEDRAFASMASYSCIEASVRNRDSSALIHELAHALSRAERSVVRQLTRILEDEGITVDQWRILQLLADDRGHRMSELS